MSNILHLKKINLFDMVLSIVNGAQNDSGHHRITIMQPLIPKVRLQTKRGETKK